MPKTATKDAPIMENEYVKELLDILKKHKSPSMKDFKAMVGHIAAMEKNYDDMKRELAAMRSDYEQAVANNHPIKKNLQRAVINLNSQVLNLRDKLAEVKQAFIDGCKNAVTAFKEKGISALDNIARFFKIKPLLEATHKTADNAYKIANQVVGNIEAASKRYHEAEMHFKNAGRALSGKGAITEAKDPGVIAKIISAPFRGTRFCFKGIRNNTVAAVGKLNRLEERAAEKTSIKKDMEKYNKQIEQAGRDEPMRTRQRTAAKSEI